MSAYNEIHKDQIDMFLHYALTNLNLAPEIEWTHVKRDKNSIEIFVKGGNEYQIASIINGCIITGFEPRLVGTKKVVLESGSGGLTEIYFTKVENGNENL